MVFCMCFFPFPITQSVFRFGGFSFGETTKLAKLNNRNVHELLQKFSAVKTADSSSGIDNDKIWSNVALLLHSMATEDIVKVILFVTWFEIMQQRVSF